MAKKKVSPIEREAQTHAEATYVIEARERSVRLLDLAEDLYAYLNGGSGGPHLAEHVQKEAIAINTALTHALGARMARIELEEAGRK